MNFRVLALCAIANLAHAAAPAGVDFDRDIRPILSDNCFACHGPDEKQRMATLRLDIKEGMFADRSGHPIIIPGDAAASRLYERVSAKEKQQRMPQPYSERTLTDQQIDLIRKWIDQGAKWEMHWAYVPPKRPDAPHVRNGLPGQHRTNQQPISMPREKLHRLMHAVLPASDRWKPASPMLPHLLPENPFAYEERAVQKLDTV